MSPCNITLMMSVDLNQLEVSIMHLQREVAQQLVYLMNLARRLKARLCESAVEARFPKDRKAKAQRSNQQRVVLDNLLFIPAAKEAVCTLLFAESTPSVSRSPTIVLKQPWKAVRKCMQVNGSTKRDNEEL
ncbi:hypothetical protein T310_7352 [Rasamsonia emersonii CBS 393.64]|uniref:Uncharacterized protein n=1 Tax=Rasamsonia emersonii (strain ATCC 16479 / CBS 393.64 / IMI 116815) TaxID=1408163 RepID=A0A0F4YK88_RASE3|nr:hypothetical protein T310_7352 [Rasamsonia emersonii CBS 393.64]KKA18687.1 hypothetical protein T310_7352 [Rasamsonia emersonii CBS 393.64]